MNTLLPRGYTLLECLVVLAIAAILAGITVPSLRGRELRMARLDAVQALTRVQSEQEQQRAAGGRYADSLALLRGVAPRSPQGRYALALAAADGDSYRATAQAVGEQARDSDCPMLTLDVQLGFTRRGPSAACWGL